MGDETREDSASVAQIVTAPRSPSRKRRRREEDLWRTAEIVMVLSAMGELRAGREPTMAEKALAAEARTRIIRACEQVRPKDLFSSEAVRVLVEDLGLNRSRESGMAFRPSKMSIADRLQYTKKAMEGSEDCSVSAHSTLPHSASIGSNSDPQRPMVGKSSPMVPATGGFSNNLTSVHISTLASSLPIVKQTLTSEAQSAIAKLSVGKDSPLVVSNVEAINQRLDARINGPTYFTLVRPTTVANSLMEKVTASAILTPTAVVTQSQTSNSQGNNHEVKVIQGSHQIMKTLEVKGPVVQATQAQMSMGNQTSPGLTFVHVPTFISNHNEIAKRIMSVVQLKVPDYPNLPLSSAEYMTKPLNCQVCKIIITDAESLLVCDACEKGIHLKCLQFQGSKVIPKFDWHCPKCLLASNCKPFPPRYGRLLKGISAAKATIGGDPSILVEKNGEISEDKFNLQKVVENENLTSSRVVQAPNFDNRFGELVREPVETIKKVSEESASSSWNRPVEGISSRTPINHIEGNSGLASATPGAQTENFDSQTAVIILQETEATTLPFDSQYRGFDKQSEQSPLSTSEISRSLSESMTDLKAESEFGCSNQKHATLADFACQYQITTDSHAVKEEALPITAEYADDLMQNTSASLTDDLKDTSNSVEALKEYSHSIKEETMPITAESADDCMQNTCTPLTFELKGTLSSTENLTNQALEVDLDGENGCQTMHDEVLENGNDTAHCENSSKRDMQKFDWAGDILEVVNNRTYYKSCCINGCIIKLQDNVIVSVNNQNFYPAKLLSLWEDNKVFSKFAIVNEYCFPGNLPDGISQPSIPEKDEVYASDRRITILASLICGLCNVLPEDKFRNEIIKETDRRKLLTDQDGVPQSVFMCKWLFDESKGIFHSNDLYL